MSDNRQRPRIHRCDDKHDALIRAYAERHGIEPWQALETAIGRLKDPDGPTIDRLTEERDNARRDLETGTEIVNRQIAELAAARKVAADLRALLAKADEEHKKALRLASGMRSDLLLEREERDALRAELASARAAHKIVAARAPEIRSAAPLPADFETKVRARAKAHGQTTERTRERVIELGFSRYDALAKAKGGRAP